MGPFSPGALVKVAWAPGSRATPLQASHPAGVRVPHPACSPDPEVATPRWVTLRLQGPPSPGRPSERPGEELGVMSKDLKSPLGFRASRATERKVSGAHRTPGERAGGLWGSEHVPGACKGAAGSTQVG